MEDLVPGSLPEEDREPGKIQSCREALSLAPLALVRFSNP